MPRRPLVHGHRGARALFPENSLPAFQYALSCGADVLELDLAVTRDNVLVCSHDPAMNPSFCRGPAHLPPVIREMTFAELCQWDCGAVANPAFPRQQAIPGTMVPTFTEVLALAAAGNAHLNVETKIFADRPHLTPSPEDFARLVYESVAAFRMDHRIILQSFDFRTPAAMRAIAPAIRRSALFEAYETRVVERALEAEAHIVSPHHSLVSPSFVEQAHAAGMEVIPWTANTEPEWQRLIECGVEGIITDDPAALIAYLNR